METARSTVTATFEIGAKLVPHLEEKLRAVPLGTPCELIDVKVDTELLPIPTLEVQADVEQVLQPGHGALEADWRPGGDEPGDGFTAANLDAGKDGELAGTSGAGEPEPISGNSDERAAWPFPGEAAGDVNEEQPVTTGSADPGTRGDTSGDGVIVSPKES